MLRIINNLRPFFEDCHRRINVREYARLMRISAPTASKLLESYSAEGILLKYRFRNYHFFHANGKSRQFIDLSRTYWNERLGDLVSFIEKKLVSPTIILFGSLSKAEAKSDSDVDLAVFSPKKESGTKLDIGVYEKKIKRKIQVFWFNSLKDVKNRELASNIINGYILAGRLSG